MGNEQLESRLTTLESENAELANKLKRIESACRKLCAAVKEIAAKSDIWTIEELVKETEAELSND